MNDRECGSTTCWLFRWALPVLLISILLSGCSTIFDPESSQEYNTDQVGLVNSISKIGQLITSKHPRINGITIWLSRTNPENNDALNNMTLSIYENQTNENPVATTTVSTRSITQYTPIQISFSPITLTDTGTIFIELTSHEEIIVHGRMEDSYSRGQAYHNRVPINADIAFRLTYLYDKYELRDDLNKIRSQMDLLLPILAILFIPGYAIIRLFRLYRIYPASMQLAFSVGFSLTLIPLLYLFGTTLGIRITQHQIQGIITISLLVILITCLADRFHQRTFRFPRDIKEYFRNPLNKGILSEILIFSFLLLILFLAFIVRMIMIRDLATPAWVDSIHHGLITRLILENGALPQTYLPYLDIETTLYHPGFHSSLAAFISLSGIEINHGMLLLGQVLNASMALSVYLFTAATTRKPAAGLFAALITSAFTAMPAYYTSWGRYPQLTGLIILPIPFVLMITANNHSSKVNKISLTFCAALATAGLLLVHYRVASFLACLLISWFIVEVFATRENLKWSLKYLLFRVTPFIILTAALAFLWLIPVMRDTVLPRMGPNHSEASLVFFSDFSWHYLTPIYGKQVIALASLGVIWGLINKNKVTAVVIGWVLLLFLIANLDALNLPGGSFVNNSSVTIMLFMPLSVMAGFLIEKIYTSWKYYFIGYARYFVIIAFFIFSTIATISGSRQMISIINPSTLLSRQEDLSAINWIDENIPDDNVILINPFSWGYGLFAGNDGGGWIPTIAGNQTIPPPVLYGLGSVTNKSNINQICQEVIRIGTSPDNLWKYLIENNINYIYIGARGGVISPHNLEASSHFESIYHQDYTWLFHILP